MKKGLWGLWAILAVSFALFLITSSFETIKIGSIELKSSGLAERLTRPPVTNVESLVGIVTGPVETIERVAVKSEHKMVDTTSKTILFIGDSMLEGLSPRLAAYAKANGHTLYTVIWYSSTSKIWSDAAKLTVYIRKFRPDYIFVCLGANELFVKDIMTKRGECVKKIIKEIGNIPFVWIGPPNWKPDTGINRLIANNVDDGRYFKSDGMEFERAKDGAHPTHQSAALWMDSVVRWMYIHAQHPIKLDMPSIAQARPKKVEVLQPLK